MLLSRHREGIISASIPSFTELGKTPLGVIMTRALRREMNSPPWCSYCTRVMNFCWEWEGQCALPTSGMAHSFCLFCSSSPDLSSPSAHASPARTSSSSSCVSASPREARKHRGKDGSVDAYHEETKLGTTLNNLRLEHRSRSSTPSHSPIPKHFTRNMIGSPQ